MIGSAYAAQDIDLSFKSPIRKINYLCLLKNPIKAPSKVVAYEVILDIVISIRRSDKKYCSTNISLFLSFNKECR